MINAMKDSYEWPMPKGEPFIIEKMITSEKVRSQQEVSMKKSRLQELCMNCAESLKNNKPDPFIFYYNQYMELVKKLGNDLGQKIENPYLIIARYIKDDSVENILKALRDNGFSFNEKKSIGYWQEEDENKIVTYSYTNPAGCAIQWGNVAMLTSLIRLGINCKASARKQGSYLLGAPIPCSQVEYNAFEYAIYDKRSNLVQLIYGSDPTIVFEGNPLKIALEVTSKSEDPDRTSLFALVHELVGNQKDIIDHSLLKVACIDYGDAQLATRLLTLGYKADIKLTWFDLTTAEKVLEMFKNIKEVKFDAKCVANLVIALRQADAFNEQQRRELNNLVKERVKRSSDQRFKDDKECKTARLINLSALDKIVIRDEEL